MRQGQGERAREREWETGRGRESERYGIFKIIINGNSERDALV